MRKIEATFISAEDVIRKLLAGNTYMRGECRGRSGLLPGIQCALDAEPEKEEEPALTPREQKAFDKENRRIQKEKEKERKKHPNLVVIDFSGIDERHENNMHLLLRPSSGKTCKNCHISINGHARIVSTNRVIAEECGSTVMHPNTPITIEDDQKGLRVTEAIFTESPHSSSQTRIQKKIVVSQNLDDGRWTGTSTTEVHRIAGTPGKRRG